jgi:N-acetylmuramoyl-L-alanine amidase CwlA
MVRIINGKDLVGTINGITVISGSYPPKKKGVARTCIPLEKVTSVTVHNTGNASKGAGARNHFMYLHNVEISGERYVGYHFVVDDRNIYQCLPLDEVSYHCGERKGNYNSISVEICENVDMNYDKAEENAVALIKELLKLFNITEIKSHKDWSGKNCPHKILPYWNEFIERCKGGDTNVKKLYRVQVGAFAIKENALRLQEELRQQGYDAIIKEN